MPLSVRTSEGSADIPQRNSMFVVVTFLVKPLGGMGSGELRRYVPTFVARTGLLHPMPCRFEFYEFLINYSGFSCGFLPKIFQDGCRS